jgi:predicted HTH transcriptional regulator
LKNAPINAPVNIAGLKTPKAVIALIQANPSITRGQMAELIGKDIRTIGRAIKKLRDEGKLHRVGSDKTGHWEAL